MKNEITVFNNEVFGNLRSVNIDGEPWFVGNDVAEALGYARPRKAILDHVDEEDKMKDVPIRDPHGVEQYPTWINESGLYSLTLKSKLPAAKKFKRWVTSEVLPSIRKTGAYMLPEVLQQATEDPEYLKYIVNLLNEDQKRKQLITVEVVKLNTSYHDWNNTQVTPLINELQKFHPSHTNYEMLKATYRALKAYDGFDVYAMRDNFIAEQMHIAKENNLEVSSDEFRVPYLYMIYENMECRLRYMKTLYEMIETEYSQGVTA